LQCPGIEWKSHNLTAVVSRSALGVTNKQERPLSSFTALGNPELFRDRHFHWRPFEKQVNPNSVSWKLKFSTGQL
jgi:hypothetical protein